MRFDPSQVRKALVAVATALSEAIALGLLDGTAEKVAVLVLAVLGAYGVWRVPNEETV